MDRETRLHVALDMLKEVIERDEEIPLKTFGLSMRPSIRGGEWIVVRRAGAEEIGVGDVVIYQSGPTFVAHRVIRQRHQGGRVYFTVKGDAHLAAEGEVAADEVVARVVALKKADKTIDLSPPRWRLANRLIALYSSWVDRLYRGVPFLHGILRRASERPWGRLAIRLVSGLNCLPPRLLIGSWEMVTRQSEKPQGQSTSKKKSKGW
jgi:hypothetical protein